VIGRTIFYFFFSTKVRWLRSQSMHETAWLRLSPRRLYCIRQPGITNGTTETATMAAEYHGIFLAARSPLSFVSSRERRANLFDRRVNGHPPTGSQRDTVRTIPLRFKRHRVSPLGTIAMIAEISWRERYEKHNAFLSLSLSRRSARLTANARDSSCENGVQFNARKRRSRAAAGSSDARGRARVASARFAWRTDCGDNCNFLSAV